MSYTTIQVKRTNNKTLDDSSLANIVPAYGEIVFSHTIGKDEFVIGDNSTTIPNLPRLNMQAAGNMSKFDGNKLTLGDNTHQGSIELYDGSNNKTTIVPSSTSNDITVTLPSTTGRLTTETYVTNAINNLDVSSVGGTGKYISAISQADGKISATATDFDSALSSTSTNGVQNKVVNDALASKAPLASPTFTGTPKAPTPSGSDNSTNIATTAFVNTAISNNTKVVLPTSAPSSYVTGQMYVDLTDINAPILKVWNGSAWKPVVGVWG